MARRQSAPRRRRILVGTEGESERSLAAWLQHLCDASGRLHLHLDTSPGSGGDGFRVVEDAAARYLKRSRQHGRFSDGPVLLDTNRLMDDRRHGRDPMMAVRGTNLRLILLRPNLEGVLARLHVGCEERTLSVQDTTRVLRMHWPDYRKPASAQQLGKRFGLHDLQRASVYDAGLREILELLGLS